MEIVWEYVILFFHDWTEPLKRLNADYQNPYVAQLGGKAERLNTVYRCYRVPYDWVPQLKRPVEKAVIPPLNSKFRIEPQK